MSASRRRFLTEMQREVVARELCEGVPGANPRHPQLQRDIESAVFCMLQSPALRVYVNQLAAAGGPDVVKRVPGGS